MKKLDPALKAILPFFVILFAVLFVVDVSYSQVTPKKKVKKIDRGREYVIEGITEPPQKYKTVSVPLEKGAPRADRYPGQGSIKLDLEVDEDSSVYTETRMVVLEEIDAAELEPFVRKSLSKYGTVSVNSIANMLIITDIEPKLSDLVRFVRQMDEMGMENFVQLETRVVPLANVEAEDIVSIISGRLSSDGEVQAEENLNVLVVTDVTGKIDYVVDIIKQLDRPPQQLTITVKVLLLHDTDFSDVGIDISTILDTYQYTNSVDKYDRWNKSSYDGEVTNDYSKTRKGALSYSVSADDVIGLMVGTGRAEMVADTRIVTINNKTGYVTTGNISEYSRSSYSTVNYTGGLRVSVLPNVGTGDLIKIALSAESGNLRIPDPDSITSMDVATPSYLSERSLQATFFVKDGDTFVAGGLDSQSETFVKRRSPILGQIPLLKEIFTKKTRIVEKQKFLIFITPRLVKPGADVSEPSDEQYEDYGEDEEYEE